MEGRVEGKKRRGKKKQKSEKGGGGADVDVGLGEGLEEGGGSRRTAWNGESLRPRQGTTTDRAGCGWLDVMGFTNFELI